MDLPSRWHGLKGTDLNQPQRRCEKKLSTDDTDYADFLREIEFETFIQICLICEIVDKRWSFD